VMPGVEHDEAILICALQMRARRLLRRHCPSPLSPALTPRNDNSEVFQQSHYAPNPFVVDLGASAQYHQCQ